MNTRAQRLQLFAERVLVIMERHEEWNSETTDEIASAAIGGKLAYANKEGQFRASRPRKVKP